MLKLALLYRGPVASCNFTCSYCPFEHGPDTPEVAEADRLGVMRLVQWTERQSEDAIEVLFTPRGEALLHTYYREAVVRLSHARSVRQVAIQTNLSGELSWLERSNPSRVAFWCSYHPAGISRPRFLAQRARLADLGISHSVGMVGVREHLEEIEAMRRELPDDVYLWVNAHHRGPECATAPERARIERIDPLFSFSDEHPSLGAACATGETVVSVDHEGRVRRCHFVDEVLGYLDDRGFIQHLRSRPCPNTACRCYIGYAHLERLRLRSLFGGGLLARIPIPALPSVEARHHDQATAERQGHQ